MVAAPAEKHALGEIEVEAPRELRGREADGAIDSEARLADGRERRRRGADRHDLDGLVHAAARSENFAYRLRNDSLTESVGPLRCFARMTSARPCWSDSSL